MLVRIQIILCFFSCLFFLRCQVEVNPCSLSEDILKDIHQLDSLINLPEIIKSVSTQNNKLHEPTIFESKNETYRFKRSSSFYNTEIYRIEKQKDFYHAIIKEYDGGYGLIYLEEKKISKKIWTEITNKIKANNFWIYPTGIAESKPVLDGVIWELEGFKPIKDKCTFQNYHAVSLTFRKDSIFKKSITNSFTVLRKKDE